MSNDDEKLNKESQLNVGIYAIRVSLYNNLGKPVDLNSKMFVFPDGSSLTSELNNNPYLSSNIKYNTRKLDKMTHPECIQTFFNKRAFINFLRDEQIIDYETQTDQDENKTVQENVETMLEYMFPMSFPVIKVVKRKSAPITLGFIKAFKKEFFKKKYNTFLNIGGKTNTVDGVTVLDTFSTNPVYIKAFEIIQKYKQQIIPAHEELFKKLKDLHVEFSNAVETLSKHINDKSENDGIKLKIQSKYFSTELNLTKSVKEMNDQMESIQKFKLTQKDFSKNFKQLRDELKSYSEYLDEIVKNKMFEPNKKLREEDNIKSRDRQFYDKVYIKLYKLTNIKKLINVCYFLTLIPYIETYRDNLSNYDVSPIADLKKYGFHKKTIDDFTQYYFPKRMTLNEDVKVLFNSGTPGNEIDIVEIEKMFKDRARQKNRIDVDKIELNNEDRNNPRYNIQVQISIFGGMVSDRIKKFIKCVYEERKIGADITRYIINSEQSEYFDLTSEIAKIEKKMANNKTDKAKEPNISAPIQGTEGKRDYVNANPANVNQANVGENTKPESNKSLTITDAHETTIDSFFRQSLDTEKKIFEANKNKAEAKKPPQILDEKSLSYVHLKQATNITADDLIKEIRSDPAIVKYINLSLNETNDMTTSAIANEEAESYIKIKSSLKEKKELEADKRNRPNIDANEKDLHEKKYTIYFYLIEIIEEIHKKQQQKKGLYRDKATGGRKTRRNRRFLRKTRKH